MKRKAQNMFNEELFTAGCGANGALFSLSLLKIQGLGRLLECLV
jgi:hypothetical protein